MQQLKELEQVKSEYSSIPVPSDGAAKLQPVMQRAKEKRVRKSRSTRYGALVAAAVLLVLLIPGMRSAFLMGGASEKSGMAFDAAMKNTAESAGAESGWMNVQMDFAAGITPVAQTVPEANVETANSTEAVAESENVQLYAFKVDLDRGVVLEDETDSFMENVSVSISKEEQDAIEKEILLQMENEQKEFYEFSSISQEQDFYLDEAGCLVVVFPAGSLAAEEYGDISFTIPKDVFSVQK